MFANNNEHMGAGMSLPNLGKSIARTAVVSFNRMPTQHQATLKGAVQTADLMLTIPIVNDDGKVQNLQHVNHQMSRNVFSLYHDAIATSDPAKETLFVQAWNQLAAILSQHYSFANNPLNSAVNVLKRGKERSDAAFAWANEGMSDIVILELLRLLIKGFQKRNEDLAVTLVRFGVLLAKVIRAGDTMNNGERFEEHFREFKEETIIVPVFAPNHAAYAVVQPSTSRRGMYRIAVCNGGSSCQKFAMRRFTDEYPHMLNLRGHCVILADEAHTAKFIELAGANWEKADVYDKLAKFISDSVESESTRCFQSGMSFFKYGNFIQLDELELVQGKTEEFPMLNIFLVEQYQGNCAVFNLIQAMVMCDVEQHKLRKPTWYCFDGVLYYTSAILCEALIKNKDELSVEFGHTAYCQVVNALVYQCLVYQDKFPEGGCFQYVIHEIVPEEQNGMSADQVVGQEASVEQGAKFSYCLSSPASKIVVGEPPASGWETVQLRTITKSSQFGLRLKNLLYPW